MATATVAIGWNGALPPPRYDSAGTTAAFKPSSSRRTPRASRRAPPGPRPAWRSSTRAEFARRLGRGRSASRKRGLERGQRHLVEAQGAHRAGRDSIRPIAFSLPAMIPH